jgi:hypothetical protein
LEEVNFIKRREYIVVISSDVIKKMFSFQMTTTSQVGNSALHFPYSSIQFLADSNQCQHLSDECIKHLTQEATRMVRFSLQVSGKKPT